MVIQISYTNDKELLMVTERLADLPLKVSRKVYKSGRFKRAYLRTKDEPTGNGGKPRVNQQ